MSSIDTPSNCTELLECPICVDGKLYKGHRGLNIHKSRRHIPNFTPVYSQNAQENLSRACNGDGPLSSSPLWMKLAALKRGVRLVKRIPRAARPLVARSLRDCVAKTASQNTPDAWEQLLTFPYKVLNIESNNRNLSLTKKIKLNISNNHIPDIHSTNNNYSNQNRSKLIENKVSDGNVKNAAKLLFSDDVLATDSSETLAALRDKHPIPSPSSHLRSLPIGAANTLLYTEDAVRMGIFGFPNGSSGGLDGLSPQHLKDLIGPPSSQESESLLKELTSLINLMLGGQVPQQIVPVLYGANLVALIKKDGSVRPIAVGSTLRRLASRMCCHSIKDKTTAILKPNQLGFGVKGGCEAAVHAARTFLNSQDYDVFVKIDVRNAFNSVDRGAMVEQIQKEIPEVLDYMWQCYGSPSKLMFGDKVLESAVGCQQGDPLGPAIFSLTINPIISTLNSKFNLWYLDDGSLGGNASSVLQDLAVIIQKFSEIGLNLNYSKCEVYIPDHISIDEKNKFLYSLNSLIPDISLVSKQNLTLLGAPIFEDAFSHLLISKLQIFQKFSHRLLDIKPHMAIYILRLCLFAPKFMYLLRCSPYWKYPSLISTLDVSLKNTLCKILNLQFDDRTWTQASLPVKFGGLGIRAISSIALPAFLSSASGSTTLISQILNLTSPTDFEVESLAEAKIAWSASCPGESFPTAMECQGLWDKPRVILTHADLIAQCTAPTDKARLMAVSEKESGHWLHAMPSHSLGTILDRTALRVAVCLRLGIKLCEPHYCPCGSHVDEFGHHGLSCIRSAGRFYRHGALNDIVRRALATASIPAQLEPNGLFRDDGKRPDGMTIVPWTMGRALVWDATCVDTLAASHLPRTSQKAGAAAESAQALKHRKYSAINQDYVFAALAFETLGPWSSDTKNFINVVSRKLIQVSGDPRAGAYLGQRLSLAVQRGNSASVLGTMPINDHLDGVYFL